MYPSPQQLTFSSHRAIPSSKFNTVSQLMNNCVSETSQSDHSRDSLAATFPTDTVTAGAKAPRRSPPNSCTPHTHSQARFPHRFHPRLPSAESQMSLSIKEFIQGAETQTQPELVPRSTLNKGIPGLLSPHSPSSKVLSRSSS